MSKISLRANRLANEFEALADQHPTEQLAVVTSDEPIGEVTTQLTKSMLREAAVLLRERGEGLTVSDEQMRELVVAANGLRYGGLNAYSLHGETEVDGLIRWLKGFSGVLVGVAERNTATERELDTLRRQREGARSFLGLDVLDELVETVDSMRVEQSGDVG